MMSKQYSSSVTPRACFVVLALCALLGLPASARADAPAEIRLAFPGVGIGNRPVSGSSVLATVQLQGKLEEEFRKDGIKISWSFLRGAGPAVNELYANGLLDFSTLGDLPSIVGRASGLTYRVLATSNVGSNAFVAAPSESSIQSIRDLRGKRVAIFKGTAGQLTANKILASFGLAERDIRAINMDTNTARAALVTKDIDAAFGGSDLLALRDQGAVRIIYTTKGEPNVAELTSNGLFLGSQDFIKRYPEITARVLKVFVRTAKEIADQDAAPTKLLQLWTKTGNTFSSVKEEWRGDTFKHRLSPLVDPYVVARYTSQIAQAKQFGLVRQEFDFESWVDRSFLSRAIKELGYEQVWPVRSADQKAAPAGIASAAAAGSH
jgi:sulfonate transport system substrate-binding protein